MIYLIFVSSIRFVRDLWPFVLDGHFRWKQTSDLSFFTVVASAPCDRFFVMCTSPLAIRSSRRYLSVLDRRSRRKCLFVRNGRSGISLFVFSMGLQSGQAFLKHVSLCFVHETPIRRTFVIVSEGERHHLRFIWY